MAQATGFPLRLQAPPRTDDINILREYIAKLANYYVQLAKETDFVVNGNIDNKNIRVNSIEADNIKAGAITAEKIDVEELSAISANLGHIIAGLIESITIIGSHIATTNGTYPLCLMSATGNLFAAYSAEGFGLEIIPSYIDGTAALSFVSGGESAGYMTAGGDDLIIKGTGEIKITSDFDVLISGGGTKGVVFDSWGAVYSNGNGQSLQSALNALSNRITALGG